MSIPRFLLWDHTQSPRVESYNDKLDVQPHVRCFLLSSPHADGYLIYMYSSVTVIMISRLFLNLRKEGSRPERSPDGKGADVLSWSVMDIGEEGYNSIELDER